MRVNEIINESPEHKDMQPVDDVLLGIIDYYKIPHSEVINIDDSKIILKFPKDGTAHPAVLGFAEDIESGEFNHSYLLNFNTNRDLSWDVEDTGDTLELEFADVSNVVKKDILYHITTKDKLPEIKKHGLELKSNNYSLSATQQTRYNAVFFTGQPEEYAKTILNPHKMKSGVILKINVQGIELFVDKNSGDIAQSYVAFEAIPPSRIIGITEINK